MDKFEKILNAFRESPVLAMVAVPDRGVAVKLAEALIAGGIKWMELTFRNEYCEDSLRELKESGLDIHYGAGTVRSKEQVKASVDAGAEFVVSPGINEEVVKYAMELGIPFFPGIDSTLGIEEAQKVGLKVLKMFPASLMGGPKWCKAMKGPYFDIQFIPSGGVNLQNLGEYLILPNVIAVGGSFLAPMKLLQEEKYKEITEIAKNAMKIVNSVKYPKEVMSK